MVPILEDGNHGASSVAGHDLRYVQRAVAKPRGGTYGPWAFRHAYEMDRERLRNGPIEDPAPVFTPAAAPVRGLTEGAIMTTEFFSSATASVAPLASDREE